MSKFISLTGLSEFLTKCKALFYTKPNGGVPKTDLAQSVQTSLGKADSAYQKPSTGIPASDIASGVIPIGNDEDIDQNEDGKMQFADRTYNVQQPNGMGYKILRKNKTFASQVTDTNTIYEIRYDFDLNNASVIIPAGCTLKFNGGKVANGTLVDALIVADREDILDNITLTGLKNGEVFPEWFGAVADGVTECSSAFTKCMSLGKTVSVSSGIYLVTNQVTCSARASIVGENKKVSQIKTNGFVLSVGAVVKNVTFKSISKTTPFLLKVTTNNLPLNEYITGIVIENVALSGAAFSEYDTGVTGMIFEAEANSNVIGFYDVNVHDVEFGGRMLYGIYFTAKSENSWITFCNFHDIFINNAKYPIEFESVAQNYYNFQNLVFTRVVAQYNYNTTQTPSTQWTQSFVRLSHCSRVSFDYCGCVDMPSGIYPFYFKDSLNGIAVTNAIEGGLDSLFADGNSTDYQKLISQYLQNNPTVFGQPFIIQANSSGNTARNTTTPPTKSLIMAKSILSQRFVGFWMTNNLEMLGERREMLLGMVDGHLVHSDQTAANGNFDLGAVYSTRYIPIYSSSFPTGWKRGAFMYWVGFRHLLCYDNYTGQWTDALNTRITTNVTKRRGSTADRTAMTMYSYNDGFLFYDTDLKKYVMWNGAGWVNVDETALS